MEDPSSNQLFSPAACKTVCVTTGSTYSCTAATQRFRRCPLDFAKLRRKCHFASRAQVDSESPQYRLPQMCPEQTAWSQKSGESLGRCPRRKLYAHAPKVRCIHCRPGDLKDCAQSANMTETKDCKFLSPSTAKSDSSHGAGNSNIKAGVRQYRSEMHPRKRSSNQRTGVYGMWVRHLTA